MEATTIVVPGVDGEPIRVEDFGDRDGKPVLVHHGSPGSRRLFRPDAQSAAQRFGLRLLSYDRPGYAGRPRRPDRRIADAIPDVRRIAEALDIRRLGVWGFSGGDSYALACAALLPELVSGAAVFSCFAPYGSPGLDFSEGWPAKYRHPTAIQVPVRLWHGAHDRAVPIAHGRWLAAHVPGIVAHLIETEDHTNVEHDNREQAYAWLSGLA
jgi:pimeloyl-ACP methyl ester carboxylesterase